MHLNRKMKLVDMLQHVEHCVSVMRKNERALDAVASHTIPFTKITAHPLEIAASYIYTPVMFARVKRQIVEGTNWQVTDRVECAGLVKYDVLRKVPYDKVPYAKDAKDLQGKDGKDLDAKVPKDLEGKDGEELDDKALEVIYHVTCVFTNSRLVVATGKFARMKSQTHAHIYFVFWIIWV